jgi:putative SOS response-associated peptidase YedK
MPLRLVIPSRAEVDAEIAVVCPWWQFSARFNVGIAHSIPVARMHARESEGVMMRWGLAHQCGPGEVNFTTCGVVRSDALQSSQELRSLWLGGQRGIVPLSGFYLWQHTAAGHHQPYYVHLVSRPVFGVAALWGRAATHEDEVIESCALIVVAANRLLGELDHSSGQMPAILHRNDYGSWLSGTVPQALQLLQPYRETQMLCHPVRPHVNYLEFDGPDLIKPV